MRLQGLLQPLKENEKFISILNELKKKSFPIDIVGLSESGKSYIIDAIFSKIEDSLVVVTHNEIEAKNLYDDLSLYSTNVYFLPIREVVFYNVDAISGDLRWARLKVIKEILDNKNKKIIVTSIEAMTSVYTPKEKYINYNINIKSGDEVNLKDISNKLIECGYERVEVVEGKGEFSFRGGILDVFPPIAIYPYRIELFGDEVDSIRTFNIESQRSIEKVEVVEIFPAKEVIVDEESKKRANECIIDELNNVIEKSSNKNSEQIQKLSRIVNKNVEMLNEIYTFETIDSYLPFFYERVESFFDYFKGYTFIIDDLKRCEGKLESIYYEFNENYLAFLQRGDILPSQNKLLINKEELLVNLEKSDVITLNPFEKHSGILYSEKTVEFKQITSNSYNGQLDLLIEDINLRKKNGYKTLILAGTRTRGERLVNTLRDRDIESVYKDVVDSIELGQVVVTFGNLVKGFEYPDLKICVISDKEVFGEAKKSLPKRGSKRKGVGKITSFAELKPGDYVVHANHGVGVFKGIKQIEIAGNTRDYLDIVYDKGDKLYVPVDQLDLVQKYIGSEGKNPKINKLGGNEWQKAKAKVRKSINEIAEDLVKLYAARAALKGYKYSKDTEWQRQFEDEFPYEETPDQLTSLEEIKHDMESDKPMDRLLCGDVGYGKTEVAIRAAFKAVMDQKQVVYLVPTTILANQQYEEFKTRMQEFAINVELLNRFKTKKEQDEIIKKLKLGEVDVVVGTHRLLSEDVNFKDLGLLIIDEEHRFGVKDKEKIKKLRTNIDVLTMTATPIPRTLHMSIVGVRDMSVIYEPPHNRKPVQTYVLEYDQEVITEAITKEIERDGQVFYLFNQVEGIEKKANEISMLVPEAKVGFAHGKMSGRELEEIMESFINQEINVLVCTTILESGIDIPNANTIIVENADRLGLAQLYQIRGRVGRSDKQAYAYVTYKRDKLLSEVADKRLKAIKEFTEFGSGFKIAMRDLEIRGAGSMLGEMQHGHMEQVGYDTYCKLLDEVIKEMQGIEVVEEQDVQIDLAVSSYIPDNFIENSSQKIEIYQNIALCRTEEELQNVIDEVIDRYGRLPKELENLIDIARIKQLARKANILKIAQRENGIVFYFVKEKIKPEMVNTLITKYPMLVKFSNAVEPYVTLRIKENEDIIEKAKEFLNTVIEI